MNIKAAEIIQKLGGNLLYVHTSNSDSVAEAAGLWVEVKCRQTGYFMFITGPAPSQAVLVQWAASASSSRSSSSSCFCTESEIYGKKCCTLYIYQGLYIVILQGLYIKGNHGNT